MGCEVIVGEGLLVEAQARINEVSSGRHFS
jgi:hypothetical protein